VLAPRLFDWLQLAALTCLVCLGGTRALVLYARGVRVLVIDRQRPPAQMLADLLLLACLVLWSYEVVAYAWPLRTHLIPLPLGSVLIDAVGFKVVGVLTTLSGLVIYVLALQAFGASWRLGIDRAAPGLLVTHGIFAWTRNPIYVALDVLAIGTFLVMGRLVFLVLGLILVAMLDGQIRREERFLAQAYGDAYRDYCARVGRYARWWA
jgi:protein-S-isoprenylcysteine O-methyltransferase Ste14